MDKAKKEKAGFVFLGILVCAILVFLFVLGINLYKNRWHKLDFVVDSITVQDISGVGKYNNGNHFVTVRGHAKAWFYDFNTYEFDIMPSASGDYNITYYEVPDALTVNNKDESQFEFSFAVDDFGETDVAAVLDDFAFAGKNISVNGIKNQSHDIRLFLSEFTDKITVESTSSE